MESGYVDKKSGIRETTPLLTYFIECTGTRGFEFVKVTRRLPSGDLTGEALKLAVTKGAVYAFNIVAFERKAGHIAARMAPVEPIPIDRDSPPASAPQGAVPEANP